MQLVTMIQVANVGDTGTQVIQAQVKPSSNQLYMTTQLINTANPVKYDKTCHQWPSQDSAGTWIARDRVARVNY